MKRVIVLLWACLSSTLLLANHWTPDNPGAYAYVMGVTSVVEINEVEQTSTQLEVGAFCGSECRGSQMVTEFSNIDRYLAMITVFGDIGDTISFRLYDHGTGQEVDGIGLTTIIFSQDGYGTPSQPIVLGFYTNLNITVTATPANGGTVAGGGSYLYNSQCTITAVPTEGYTFINWTQDGNEVATEPSYTFTVTEDAAYEAHFLLNSYVITVTAHLAEGGTVTGAGTYNHGETCTLTAEPAEGYVFVSWLLNGGYVSNSASYTFTVTGPANYVARFAEEGYLEPHWTPVTEPFQFYMAVTAVVEIDGVEQTSEWLEVGAFCGEQCRGTQIVTLFPIIERHLVMIDVFGEEGDQFTFRLYDHSTDQEVEATCLTTVNFSMDDLGTPVEPFVLEFSTSTTPMQVCTLVEGWNWWSTNLDITLNDLKAALVATGNTSITIKSKSQTTYYQNGRWRGSLTFHVEQMYEISVGNSCEIVLTGDPLNPAEHPISIVKGKNWIGFPLNQTMTPAQAFAGFATNGDVIKSKNGNTARYTGGRWRGSCDLVPGQGYQYESTVNSSRTLVFPH